MRNLGAVMAIVALSFACSGAAHADDAASLVTGRSVALSGDQCDRTTPVCAAIGSGRLVPYDNECHARADGATSVSFSGCFDED